MSEEDRWRKRVLVIKLPVQFSGIDRTRGGSTRGCADLEKGKRAALLSAVADARVVRGGRWVRQSMGERRRVRR